MSAPRQVQTMLIAAMAAVVACPSARADEIGHEELLARLGAAAPTGAGVRVVQCEPPVGSGLEVLPDPSLPEFAGKSFIPGAAGMTVSWHGTNVARPFYGIGTSIAPGIGQVHVLDANGFIGSGYLRTGSGSAFPPLSPPGPSTDPARVFNHSWIGSTGSVDNEALRRADFAMHRDGTLFCVGENNGAGSTRQPLMSCGFNSMSVGLTNGLHSAGNTPSGVDGLGRMKPDIVAPGTATSYATPVVGAAAALLYQTALTAPYAQNANRARGVTVKAALLAGASHGPAWSNNAPQSGANRGITTRPLDPVYGCGTVNVDRAHRIITADEATARATADGAAADPPMTAGVLWDVEAVQATASAQQLHYRLDLAVPGDVSVVATWNRNMTTASFASAGAPAVANMTLRIQRIGDDGQVTALSGNAGVGVFVAGNVVSASSVDNVEHLFVRGLARGRYVVSVNRESGTASAASTLAVAAVIEPRARLGDLDGNDLVNGDDLGILLTEWGAGSPSADLNLDGNVNGDDLGMLLTAWG